MSNVEYSTTIKGETVTDTIIWTVPKFLDILNNRSLINYNQINRYTRELWMEKSKDAAAELSALRFRLKMRFLGQDNDIIEIYFLSPIISRNQIETLEFKIICHKYSPKAYYEREIDRRCFIFGAQINQWLHASTLLKCDIVQNRSLFLTDNPADPDKYESLRLKITFFIHKNTYDSCYSTVGKLKVATELSHDLGQLFTSGVFSDVTMKSVDGNEYKAHRAILSSRSAVLKSYFEHNTKKCKTHIIESHFESEVLEEVLTFMYSNKVMKIDEIPEKLLAAADFYQLSTLKSWCEESLSKKLTTENDIEMKLTKETLELAELYSAKNLIQSAIELITNGQTRQIIISIVTS